jgi:hypothetical protein
MDVVSPDVVGPLPVTEQGNKYLLTFVDHFTRFCEAILIPNQDAETIAKEFVFRIIANLESPKSCLQIEGHPSHPL